MKIKGAIFDMDGTLIDSLMFWGHLWRRIGKEYMNDEGFLPDGEVDRAVRTMIYVDAMAYFKEHYGIAGSTEDFIEFAKGGILDFYRDIATVKVGAVEILTALRGRGIPVYLASATAMEFISPVLKMHGLDGYFDGILSCADIGKGKEKPDIYLLAAEQMGLSVGDVCVFEDSFVALETAKSAGFKTVGLYDKYSMGQDRLLAASDIYMKEGESLLDILPQIEA